MSTATTYTVYFTYVDYRVKGYERFGAERHLRKQFDTKRSAWSWMLRVEKHAVANDSVSLDSVTVTADGITVYQADYGREQFMWLYDHVDCHGGIWRFVK